jgi:predicted DNA-binding transcriptional regulator YafY
MPRNDRIIRVETVKRALLSSRLGVSLKVLAGRHDWKLRNLYRDIDALDAAGYAIRHESNRYWIDGTPEPATSSPDADERLALYLARQSARAWKETSLGKALDRLWHRLSATDGQAALVPVESAPWITTREWTGIDYATHRQILLTLERATRTRAAVDVRYRALSTGKTTSRIIEPGELYWDPALETMYLIAWCRLRQDVRVFAVHRFLAVILTDEICPPRPQTRSRAALHKAFRVWRSEHATKIRVWFTREVAAEIRERQWLAEQKLEEAQGGVVLSAEVAGLAEVERWVLSYGPDAKVLAPVELASSVSRKLREGAARYRTGKDESLSHTDKRRAHSGGDGT